jgi:predicted ferric reductase
MMHEATANAGRAMAVLAAMLLGGFVALQFSLSSIPAPLSSEMVEVHKWWYMGRASGFIAYGLLFGSIALGLGISSRIFDGLLVRSWVFDLHQFLSVYVLIAMMFHALIMLPDPYAGFTLVDATVPFASSYRPVAVGLGIIVLYGSVIVTLSYYAKRWIGQRGWRTLHYGSFALFIGALVHGVMAGADTREWWAQVVYLSTGFAVVFLLVFRIVVARGKSSRGGAGAKPAARGGKSSTGVEVLEQAAR